VCDLPLCRVLVVDDSAYPCWLVLVPRLNHVREVIELSEAQQAALWREVAAAARIIQDLYRPCKINIAAIGNIVSQVGAAACSVSLPLCLASERHILSILFGP
jgi:diadenosine tetraphosphate (Ap4A) HIT family hydrolase